MKKAVLFVFYNRETDKVLSEQRPPDHHTFPNAITFPIGTVEEDESVEAALFREAKEEFGVVPKNYVALPSLEGTGSVLFPFWIIEWERELPEKVLDKNSKLLWESTEKAAASPIPSRKKVINALKSHIAQKMNKDTCLICARIQLIQKGKNQYFVKEMETGFVVLGDFQYFKGYTLFLSKIHAEELHQLEHEIMKKYLEEMAHVANAVYHAFKPAKLNYELLGNGEPHLHWHIFPRYKDDPNKKLPVWTVDKAISYSESARATKDQLEE